MLSIISSSHVSQFGDAGPWCEQNEVVLPSSRAAENSVQKTACSKQLLLHHHHHHHHSARTSKMVVVVVSLEDGDGI